MTISVGISGMGRIGRLLIRRAFSQEIPSFQVVAINATYPVETLAHLLKYDTVHGKWDADISFQENQLQINGHEIQIVTERDPSKLPWKQLGIELVIDATGKFNHREGAKQHLEAGADLVLATAPADEFDTTIVMGVNESTFSPEKHKLVSAASCTTNCLSPVLKILDDAFTVKNGWMTTVHSYTNDQNHLDNPHGDLRRARACTQSIVPTSTGVRKALADVLPHLAPKLNGISLRVPTPDVSLVDLTVQVSRPVTQLEVTSAFQKAAEGAMAPYVEVCQEPLVSTDFIGNDKSAIIDSASLMVSGDQIKVLAWYDNEWGYACRVINLAEHLSATKLKRNQNCFLTVSV